MRTLMREEARTLKRSPRKEIITPALLESFNRAAVGTQPFADRFMMLVCALTKHGAFEILGSRKIAAVPEYRF